MEINIYLIVKTVCIGYILYKAYRFIFKGKMELVWEFIFTKIIKIKPPIQMEFNSEEHIFKDVIGKTKTVYIPLPEPNANIEDEQSESNQPMMSEELKPVDLTNPVEEDIDEDIDLSDNNNPPIDDDYYISAELEGINHDEFSSGITYDDISNAVDYIKKKSDENSRIEEELDEKKKVEIAKTAFKLKQTTMYDFITVQVGKKQYLEKLMESCLDEDGNPLPIKEKKASIENFNINNYI